MADGYSKEREQYLEPLCGHTLISDVCNSCGCKTEWHGAAAACQLVVTTAYRYNTPARGPILDNIKLCSPERYLQFRENPSQYAMQIVLASYGVTTLSDYSCSGWRNVDISKPHVGHEMDHNNAPYGMVAL